MTGCDIAASRGAYHPTLLHISNLFCQGFFQGSIGSYDEPGVCSFVTWKELQHNEVRELLHRGEVLHF